MVSIIYVLLLSSVSPLSSTFMLYPIAIAILRLMNYLYLASRDQVIRTICLGSTTAMGLSNVMSIIVPCANHIILHGVDISEHMWFGRTPCALGAGTMAGPTGNSFTLEIAVRRQKLQCKTRPKPPGNSGDSANYPLNHEKINDNIDSYLAWLYRYT